MGFDPLSWGKYLLSIGGSITSDIKNFVTSAVTTAVNLVENDLDDGIDFVSTIVEDVKTGLTSSIDFVGHVAENLFDSAERDIASGVNSALAWATELYHDAEHDISAGLGYAESLARNLYNGAERDIANGINAVVHEAESLADVALSTAERYASDAVNGFVRDVFDPLANDAKQAFSWAGDMWRWFDTGVVDAWKVIMQAWDWIEWFAKWSFHAIDNLEGDFVHDVDDSVSSFLRNVVSSDFLGNLESSLKAFGW